MTTLMLSFVAAFNFSAEERALTLKDPNLWQKLKLDRKDVGLKLGVTAEEGDLDSPSLMLRLSIRDKMLGDEEGWTKSTMSFVGRGTVDGKRANIMLVPYSLHRKDDFSKFSVRSRLDFASAEFSRRKELGNRGILQVDAVKYSLRTLIPVGPVDLSFGAYVSGLGYYDGEIRDEDGASEEVSEMKYAEVGVNARAYMGFPEKNLGLMAEAGLSKAFMEDDIEDERAYIDFGVSYKDYTFMMSTFQSKQQYKLVEVDETGVYFYLIYNFNLYKRHE